MSSFTLSLTAFISVAVIFATMASYRMAVWMVREAAARRKRKQHLQHQEQQSYDAGTVRSSERPQPPIEDEEGKGQPDEGQGATCVDREVIGGRRSSEDSKPCPLCPFLFSEGVDGGDAPRPLFVSSTSLQLDNAFRRREPPTVGPVVTATVMMKETKKNAISQQNATTCKGNAKKGVAANSNGSDASSPPLSSLPPSLVSSSFSSASVQVLGLEQRLFLMRHAERLDHVDPKWKANANRDATNGTAALYYSEIPATDPPLSNTGRRQAVEAAVHFLLNRVKKGSSEAAAAWSQSFVVCSPYLRCLETALAVWLIGLGGEVPFVIDPRLGDFVQPKSYKAPPSICGSFEGVVTMGRNTSPKKKDSDDADADDDNSTASHNAAPAYRLPRQCLASYADWLYKRVFIHGEDEEKGGGGGGEGVRAQKGKSASASQQNAAPLLPKWVTPQMVSAWRRRFETIYPYRSSLPAKSLSSLSAPSCDSAIYFPIVRMAKDPSLNQQMVDKAIRMSITECFPEGSRAVLEARSKAALCNIMGAALPPPEASAGSEKVGGCGGRGEGEYCYPIPFAATTIAEEDVDAAQKVSAAFQGHQIASIQESFLTAAPPADMPPPPPLSALVVTHADNVAACVTALCPQYHNSKFIGSGVAVPYASLTILRRLTPCYGLATQGASSGATTKKGGDSNSNSSAGLRKRNAGGGGGGEGGGNLANHSRRGDGSPPPALGAVYASYFARHCQWSVGEEGPSHGANAAFASQPPMGSMNHLVTAIRVTK